MHMRFLRDNVAAGQSHTAPRTTPGLTPCALDIVQHGLTHRYRAKTRKDGHLQQGQQRRTATWSQRGSVSPAPYIVSNVDLSFDGWGENSISEVRMEPPLGVEDLVVLADSCARQLRENQELLTLHASLSSSEEHACSLDGSGCGPEMPEPASSACKVQDLDFDRSMDSWSESHFAMVLWGAGVEQLAHDRGLAQQILSVLTPGGLFMIPVRAAGCVHMRTHVLSSSRFARQLLHSAGFADIQCSAHVTALPGFSQSLPGDVLLVTGKRPGTAEGLEAAEQAAGLGYPSRTSIALGGLSNREGGQLAKAVQDKWLHAYKEMTKEAITMGIPASALPKLPENTTAAELQEARMRLSGMIASFMSSGL